MAVAQSPNSKASVPAPLDNNNKKKNNKKKKMKEISSSSTTENNGDNVEMKTEMESDKPKPKKRNPNPGVRVIHGKIYDSKNGTTCHQCRQKTLFEYVSCKNKAKTKPCPLKYCVTCLLNRYGEKAEEVSLLDQWDCPRCKDVCNCSICMKKRGHQPTGMVSPMAKAGGFTSVSDMIHAKGAQNVCNYKRVKETCASPGKLITEGIMITSPKKSGKENLFDGKTDPNVDLSLPVLSPAKVKPSKKKRKGVQVTKDDTGVSDKADPNADPSLPVPALAKEKPIKKKRKGVEVTKDDTGVSNKADPNADPSLPVPSLAKEKPIKKKRKGDEVTKDDTGASDKADPNADPSLPVPSLAKAKPIKKKQKGVEVTKDDTGVSDKALNEKKPKKLKSKASKETIGVNVNNGELSKENTSNHDQNATQHLKDNKSKKVKKNDLDSLESVIPLPMGSDLVTIAGVDLSKEDAGNALQLLEFCSTFGKILDVKKGQAEAILRDLFKGPSSRTRSGKCTSVIQFYIQLLPVLQEESDSESVSESSQLHLAKGNGSWLKVLKNCISKSRLKHLDSIDTTAAGYDNLDSSTKLGLLIFLCDEVLGTEKIRNWIDNENTKFAEKKKEAKEKLCAAKNKEKSLKQKMLDEIAKAIIANDGVPITTKEHDSVVSKIKKKAAEAHAEMLECQKMGPQDKGKPDAVRIVPIFKDNKGHMYWRLKGCSDKPGILLQDIGTGDHMVGAADKWFGFDDEQIKLIEGHFNILRSRFKKYYKN